MHYNITDDIIMYNLASHPDVEACDPPTERKWGMTQNTHTVKHVRVCALVAFRHTRLHPDEPPYKKRKKLFTRADRLRSSQGASYYLNYSEQAVRGEADSDTVHDRVNQFGRAIDAAGEACVVLSQWACLSMS